MRIKKAFFLLTLVAMLAFPLTSATMAQGLPGSGWWTGAQVQNVGTAASTISMRAIGSANSTAVDISVSANVEQSASKTFTPFDFMAPNPVMPDGFQGAAIVSADQDIRAIVNVVNLEAGSLGVTGGTAQAQYQGTNQPDTTLYFPLVKNTFYGESTAFYVQNAGSSAANIVATFSTDDGQTYPVTKNSVAAGAMVVILPADAGVPACDGNNEAGGTCKGSLKVTSTANLAGTVLEYVNGQSPAKVLKGTRADTAADFSTKAYAPIVKKNFFGAFTGIQVLNVGTGPIDVTISYKAGYNEQTNTADCGTIPNDVVTGIPAGRSRTVLHYPGFPIGTGDNTGSNFPEFCYGSATINATGNFVAIVNEAPIAGGKGTTYSAIPSSRESTKLSAPLFKSAFFESSSGFSIQNVGSAAASVVATFKCTKEDATTFTAVSNAQTVATGGVLLFYQPQDQGSMFATAFASGNANCGVSVTSNQPIVGIINEQSIGATALDDNNYEAFNMP